MKQINMDVFYDAALSKIKDLQEHELIHIQEAAQTCAESMANNGAVHIFGSGHSVGFGLELKGRPGSLVPFHMIETSDFVTRGLYSLEEFKDPNNIFERRPNISGKLYDLYDIRKEDSFIIISNSGINGLVIDLATTAKEKGHKVIIITSMEHTLAEPSRHPSGKKLYELGDIVIDNRGPQGDALLETGDIEKVCSISSITGAVIAQSLTEYITKILVSKGITPPLLQGSHVEGYKEHNEALLNEYEPRWR